ncbi:cytochrome P450 [Hypoxylon trugodes]|uniref:cytochrome P450 n=1 Tax=Hypoxylon trugodes TaxID=326681 RepID=UPI00218E418D|nr:cytochrome P450 [Hypoxylon trugodes]KAI1387795.1 cytochrome P450 [Hypoxylon trugodes]
MVKTMAVTIQTLFSPTAGATACLVLALLYCVRRVLLPKPIPGIPYNKASAGRILGDVPDVLAWKAETMEIWSYVRKLAIELDSPVIQMFMRPYAKPWVIVNDFREAMDIQTYRNTDFDRAHFLGDIFKPLLPGNHVWMPTGDQFRANRQLIRDTMSPFFLYQVAGPGIHSATQGLLRLWRERARLAQGHAFEADNDIFRATVDVILTATFGFEIGAVVSQADILSKTDSINLSVDMDKPAIFPAIRDPDEFTSIRTLVDSVEIAMNSPVPRFSLSFALKFHPSLRKARAYKDRMIDERLKMAWEKFAEGADRDDRVKCAVDLLVQREVQMANKEKRAIQYDTLAIRDELFGFLQAGHETGSTTLCWAVKYLTANQNVQQKLRAALKSAHTRAVGAGDMPSAEEIAKANVPYLDAFIEETHRCGTTSSAVVRVAIRDTTILGHKVPKGSDIFLLNNGPSFQTRPFDIDESSRTATSREAKDKYGVWNPSTIQKFWPERWLVEEKAGSGEIRFDPYAGPVMAFGTGLRGCFGTKLASLELKIIITLIVWCFELQETPTSLSGFGAHDKNTRRPQQVYLKLKEVGI